MITSNYEEMFPSLKESQVSDPLLHSKSIRIQFAKFAKGVEQSDIDQFIKQHVGVKHFASIGRLSFPNEWEIRCKTDKVREALIRLGRTKVNGRTCWIYPLSNSEIRGYVHWIPNEISNDMITVILEKHGQVLFIESQKQTKWRGNADSRYFALHLRPGQTKQDIPHFIKVASWATFSKVEFQGLITIKGRDPACLFCKTVGHRKSECVKFHEKLNECSSQKPKEVTDSKEPNGQQHNPKAAETIAENNKNSEVNNVKHKKKKKNKKGKKTLQELASTSNPVAESVNIDAINALGALFKDLNTERHKRVLELPFRDVILFNEINQKFPLLEAAISSSDIVKKTVNDSHVPASLSAIAKEIVKFSDKFTSRSSAEISPNVGKETNSSEISVTKIEQSEVRPSSVNVEDKEMSENKLTKKNKKKNKKKKKNKVESSKL